MSFGSISIYKNQDQNLSSLFIIFYLSFLELSAFFFAKFSRPTFLKRQAMISAFF